MAQLQAAFPDNRMKTRAIVLHGAEYFPALKPAGPHRCQMFKSSPMEGSESARLRAFDADLRRAREVTYADWLARPVWQRATDGAAAFFRSQL